MLGQAQHLDVLAGALPSQRRLEAAAQKREAVRRVPVGQRPGAIEGTGLALQQGQVVERIEAHPLALPDAGMDADQLVALHDAHLFDAAGNRELVVGVGGRHRVVVCIEAHQRERVGPRLGQAAGLEALDRQGQHRLAVGAKQLGLGLGLAPELAVKVGPAALLKVSVELTPAGKGRHGHQEVAPPVAHQRLDVTLLVAAPHAAEAVPKEEVGLQAQELAGELTLTPDDARHCDLRVVVVGLCGHPAKEGEGGTVRVLEALGALARVGADEEGIRVGQAHHREVRLAGNPGDLHGGLAEVELGAAG